MEDVSEWMGTQAAARHLDVTTRGLYRLIDEGVVPAFRMGRVIRLRRSDVDEVLALGVLDGRDDVRGRRGFGGRPGPGPGSGGGR